MMDEREALARILWQIECDEDNAQRQIDGWSLVTIWADPWHPSGCSIRQQCRYLKQADRILAAGYRLPTTGEIAAERRGWEQGRDAAIGACRAVLNGEFDSGRDHAEDVCIDAIRALTPPDQMQRALSPAAQSEGGE